MIKAKSTFSVLAVIAAVCMCSGICHADYEEKVSFSVTGFDGSELCYTLNNVDGADHPVTVMLAGYDEEDRFEFVNTEKNINIGSGETVSGTIHNVHPNAKIFVWDPDSQMPYTNSIIWNELKADIPETIKIEGENTEFANKVSSDGAKTAMNMNIVSGKGVSQDKLAFFTFGSFDPDKPYTYELSYYADCTASGFYELSAVSGRIDEHKWVNDYAVSVNGKEAAVFSRDAVLVEALTIDFSGALESDLLGKYSLGRVYLPKGKNKITINVDMASWDGSVCNFYLDYLELTPYLSQGTVDIKTVDSPLGIFTESNGADFEIFAEGIAAEDTGISYTVSDHKGLTVASGQKIIEKGTGTSRLKLMLETGYYTISLGSGREKAFVIVPDPRDSNASHDPFGIDLASAWHTDSHFLQRAYAKAAVLAGAGWVRDRFNWAELSPTGTSFLKRFLADDTIPLKKEGLLVSETFHSTPSWAKTGNNKLPSDPKKMYDLIYNIANSGTDSFADIWEIWNEQDASLFSNEGADKYAAMLKAAAIASDNSQSKPLIAIGGFAAGANTSYADILLQNEVLNYSDIYNFHVHTEFNAASESVPVINTNKIKGHYIASLLYSREKKPVWQTESGLKQPIVSGGLTDIQKTAQAEYMVKKFMIDVSLGTDKQFAFLGLPFTESDGTTQYDFGLFDADGSPRPAYATIAVMADMLKGTNYYGSVKGLPANAYGYAMYKDNEITEVIWSDADSSIAIPSPEGTAVYDMMGKPVSSAYSNSELNVSISKEPIYIVFPSVPENVYENARAFTDVTKHELTDNDKIVLWAEFPQENGGAYKHEGYSLSYSNSNTIPVTVYNFSDREMSGYILAAAEGGAFNVECPDSAVTVPAGGSTEVNITINRNSNTVFGAGYDIKLYGLFNGENTSPLVALVNFNKDPEQIAFTKLTASDAITGDGWQTPSKTSNVTASMGKTSGGVRFSVSTDGNPGYYYPFVFARSQDLSGFDGIRFTVGFDKTVPFDYNNYMTVQISDGSSMFTLPAAKLVSINEGTASYAFLWRDFTTRSTGSAASLASVLGRRMFIKIGVHSSQAELNYTLSDVGFFTIGSKSVLPEISASAYEDNGTIVFNASLPEGLSGLRMFCDGKEINAGSSVRIQGISQGPHTLIAAGYTATGRAVYKTIDINTETNTWSSRLAGYTYRMQWEYKDILFTDQTDY